MSSAGPLPHGNGSGSSKGPRILAHYRPFSRRTYLISGLWGLAAAVAIAIGLTIAGFELEAGLLTLVLVSLAVVSGYQFGGRAIVDLWRVIAPPPEVTVLDTGVRIGARFLPWRGIDQVVFSVAKIERDDVEKVIHQWCFERSNARPITLRLAQPPGVSDYVDVEAFNALLAEHTRFVPDTPLTVTAWWRGFVELWRGRPIDPRDKD